MNINIRAPTKHFDEKLSQDEPNLNFITVTHVKQVIYVQNYFISILYE